MEPTSEQAPPTVQAHPEDSVLGAEPAAEAEQQHQPVVEDAPARPTYGEFKLPEGVTADAESLTPATELFAETGLSGPGAEIHRSRDGA